MNPESSEPSSSTPRVRAVGPPNNMAVFNCRVIVAGSAESGEFTARGGDLAGIHAQGSSQREAMQAAVSAFKAKVAQWYVRGEEIPWVEPPEQPRAGEREFYVAVHL